MWAEPTVKLPCSRSDNRGMYIASVTPYIPGMDGAKNSLVGACELLCNEQILTKNITGICIMASIGEQSLFYNQ